ncbi:MAG: hypothetical protein AB7I59_27955 [Geminicoccaceae bacterium]
MNARTPMPELNRDMGSASDEQLLRVVGLIDTLDRRGTVDGLLAPVRARLALLRPPRPLTLGRVAVMPFEDLLVPSAEAWADRCCFPREKLGWFVEQVPAALAPHQLEELRRRAAGRSMLEAGEVRAIGEVLWPAAAAAALRCAEAHEPASDLRRQLSAVAPLLSLGPALLPTLWQLPPRPMGTLDRQRADLLLAAVRGAVALGEQAAQSVLELLLVRSSSPLVVLEPLRHAELGIEARRREAMLARLVRRRIADMRTLASRLTDEGANGPRPSAAQLLRLVSDLDALEGKWPLGGEDRDALAAIREQASAGIGAGIEAAVGREILGPLATLAAGELSDDEVERLENCARNTRRLSIAGARLGLAATPDAMLGGYLPAVHEAIRHNAADRRGRRGLLEQLRVVEIMFGSDAAAQLYGELRAGQPA